MLIKSVGPTCEPTSKQQPLWFLLYATVCDVISVCGGTSMWKSKQACLQVSALRSLNDGLWADSVSWNKLFLLRPPTPPPKSAGPKSCTDTLHCGIRTVINFPAWSQEAMSLLCRCGLNDAMCLIHLCITALASWERRCWAGWEPLESNLCRRRTRKDD